MGRHGGGIPLLERNGPLRARGEHGRRPRGGLHPQPGRAHPPQIVRRRPLPGLQAERVKQIGQGVEVEGLYEIVAGPKLKGQPDDRGLRGLGGHHHSRALIAAAQGAEEIKPVHPGQNQIQQHDIGPGLLHQLQPLQAVLCQRAQTDPLPSGQKGLRQHPGLRIILHHQDPDLQRHAYPSGPSSWAARNARCSM